MRNTFARAFLSLAATLAVGAGAVALTCNPPPPEKPRPLSREKSQLKVMTFNVNFGGVDMERSAGVVERSGADLVALQETTPRWEALLRRRLGRRYPHMLFRRGGGAGGMGILSRYPVREVGWYSPPPGGWFPAWLLRVQTPRGPLQVLNVHLRPPLGPSGVSSLPVTYFSTRAVRLREIRQHLSSVSGKLPLVVLGDFNEADSGRAVRYLARKGLRSALARYDSRTATWQWRTSLGTVRSRLDHIFHSRHLRCLGAQVLGEAASDHFPVEAVLAWSQD
jgi:endonuclease/exonuclease/phosphatase (EEP) superfamily protein YafD